MQNPMTPLTEALRRADHETGYEPEELAPYHHYAELVVQHLREIELERKLKTQEATLNTQRAAAAGWGDYER